MSESGGVINGRRYSIHALERMPPDIPGVRATLNSRAKAEALKRGLKEGTEKYNDIIKKYSQPRNIPPMVIEDAIVNGVKHLEIAQVHGYIKQLT